MLKEVERRAPIRKKNKGRNKRIVRVLKEQRVGNNRVWGGNAIFKKYMIKKE